MERHVEQAALLSCLNLRQAGNGLSNLTFCRYVQQSAPPFGDQHSAIGKEGQAPWMGKAFGYRFQEEFLLAAGHAFLRAKRGCGKRQGGDCSDQSHFLPT